MSGACVRPVGVVSAAGTVSTGLEMMLPTSSASRTPPGRPVTSAAKECIHSGHFMVSNVDVDRDNAEDASLNVPLLEEGASYACHVKQDAECSSQFGPLSSGVRPQLAIDDSLTKLFNTLTIAYKQQISNPRWNMFKGMRLNMKDKIRLNNVIWRCWHIQFVRRSVQVVCRFASPSDDEKHIPPAVVLEGKYWKRKPEAVSAEYKKWRTYSKQRLHRLRVNDSVEASSRSPRRTLWPAEDPGTAAEIGPQPESIDLMDFSNDTLMDLLMQQPYAFPNPREIARLGVADLIQPGLVQLQPNFDCGLDLMDTMEPLDGWLGSRLPTLVEEPSAASVPLSVQQASLLPDASAEQCLSLLPPDDTAFPNISVQFSTETDNQLIVPLTDSPIQHYSPSPPSLAAPHPVSIVPDSFAIASPSASVKPLSAVVVSPAETVFVTPSSPAVGVHASPAPAVQPTVVMAAPAEAVFVTPSSPRRAAGSHSMRRMRGSHSLGSAPVTSRTALKGLSAVKQFAASAPAAACSGPGGLQRRRSLTDVQMARSAGAMVRSFSDSSGATAAAIRGHGAAVRSIACAPPASATPALVRPAMLTQLLESPSPTASGPLPIAPAPPPPPVAPATRPSGKQRRLGHSSSEQRRRGSIKGGFDQLYRLVPTLHSASAGKLSKAALLHKGADFIHQLRSDCSRLQEDLSSLRANIDSINQEISDFQAMLPASGAPITRVRQHRLREMLDEYVRERTLANWRFFVFAQLLPPLLESYSGAVGVGGGGGQQLLRSVLAWQQNCALTQLRPFVTTALRQLSRTTSVLSEPERLPQEAVSAVSRQPDVPLTRDDDVPWPPV